MEAVHFTWVNILLLVNLLIGKCQACRFLISIIYPSLKPFSSYFIQILLYVSKSINMLLKAVFQFQTQKFIEFKKILVMVYLKDLP